MKTKWTMLALTALAATAVTHAGPFDTWDIANPLRVAYPASSGGGASVFDIVASTVGPDSFYATTMLGTPAAFGVAEYTLNRSAGGLILPLANPTDPTENRRWQMPLANTSSGAYNKALDVLSEDANSVRILTAVEAGTNANGSVEMVTITNRATGTGSSALWKDLTSEQADGTSFYGPEGIAVDRVNQRVLVVTDENDGIAPGETMGANIYNYDLSYAVTTPAQQKYGLTAAGNAGSVDGRQATALADGSFLVRVGSGTERGLWKVDASGNATELLNDTDLGAVSIQDTIIHSPDGGTTHNLYMALATPDAEIRVYGWNNVTQSLLSTTPSTQLSLEYFKPIFGWSDAGYLAGLSFTTNGELLMSFANSGSPGGVVAFNLLQVPEPASLTLLALGSLTLLCRRRRPESSAF